MWGSCFWFCIPSASVRRLPPPHTQLVHTHNLSTHNLLTHNLSTHNLLYTQLTHTQLVHTQLDHTQLTHTQLAHAQLTHTHNLFTHNLSTHNLLTHNLLPHTTCSHTTQLTHTQLVHTQLVHTQLTHTQLTHTQLVHTQLVHTQLVTLRGRRGTYGTGLALVARLVPRRRCDAAAFCVAGVALCHIHLHFVWQAWHLMTWIVTLRGRRGTYGTGLALVVRLVPRRRCDAAAFCVAGVAFVTLCGRRGTWWHGLLLCVAGVALMALGWLWWRAWFPEGAVTPRRFAWQAWHFVTSTFTLCGRRGTWWLLLCVAGVALMALGWLWWRAWFPGGAVTLRRFAWQAWHFVTSTFTLCGRRGTWWHGLLLCVAGVALMALGWLWWRAWFPGGAVTPWRFAWQAWHFVTSTFTLCGRRGTWWHGLLLCVAGVALMALGWLWWRAWFPGSAVTPRRFAWQAWHFVTSTFTLCGRRGAWRHRLLLCVAGVALMPLGRLWWRAWSAGGAVTPWRFAWQAWHFVTSTFTLCGRRGTWWHGLLLCVAGVALMALGWLWWRAWFPGGAVTPRRFAWQAWHFVTSTFTLCGRRGTWRHRLLLCVAGVALCDIHLHFVWQAWHLMTSIVTLHGRRGTYGTGILLVVASLPGDDRCCLCVRVHGWHFLSFASLRIGGR